MKNILITGAGTGIGKAAAIALSKKGHFVFATTYKKYEAIHLNSLAKKYNLSLKSFKLDILSERDRNKAKNLDIDVLINNAAIGDSGSVCEIDVDRYRTVFETNVFSNIEFTQLILENMIKKGTGRIIFISSLVGRISIPFLSPYTSTKFALEAIASSLKSEMKALKNSNIEVSLIEPGAYATGFNEKNISKQFTWMKEKSYFKKQVKDLEKKQYRYFRLRELKSLDSIVKEYIKAVEDTKIKDRYIAPSFQGSYIQFKRILGN